MNRQQQRLQRAFTRGTFVWQIREQFPGANLLYAELDGRQFSQSQAGRIGQAIANVLKTSLLVVKQSMAARTPNPTLVHHGLIRGAAWHIMEEPGGDAVPLPLADLYSLHHKAAVRVAVAIATVLGQRVVLMDNRERPPRLADHPAVEFTPAGRSGLARRNPGHWPPRKGETWHGPRGESATVQDLVGKRVVVLTQAGAREWIDAADFKAAWRPSVRRTNPGTREGTSRDFAAATIRSSLKKRSGKPWSVTVGRGTAWGWLHVDSPNARRTWRWRLPPGARDIPESYQEYDSGQPGGHASPAERAELAQLLGLKRLDSYQGVSIPGAHDYYEEYMDRAQGKPPSVTGKPYWDNPRHLARCSMPGGTNPRGLNFPKVRADSLKVGDLVMPPERELRLWMVRDAREKGMAPTDLGIMLTDVHEGEPDKRGRWIVFSGYLRDQWYQGRKQYPFKFKARPDTPWPVVAHPTANRRTRNPKRPIPLGSMWERINYPKHVARVVSVSRASGPAPPMVNLEITGVSGREVYGTTRLPVNEFLAKYEPLVSNPSRSSVARFKRRQLRATYGRKERRAMGQPIKVGKAVHVISRHAARRKARTGYAGRAAATGAYIGAPLGPMKFRSRRANPKGRKFVSAHSIAASMGFPYVRGDGRESGSLPGVWLSRFTRTSDGTGPALFVGFHGRQAVVEDQHGKPWPTKNPSLKTGVVVDRVVFSKEEVTDFKSRWPASGLPSTAIVIALLRDNGDVVEVWPKSAEREGYASGALEALIADARKRQRGGSPAKNPRQRLKSKALYIVGLPTGISGFRGPHVAGIVTGARVRRDGLLPWSGARLIVSNATFRMNDGHLPDFQPRGGIQAVTDFLAANPFSEAVAVDHGTAPNPRRNPQPTVAGFVALLSSKVTQHDQAQERYERKHRIPVNIHRIGHLLRAVQDVRGELQGMESRSDPEALGAFVRSVSEHFTPTRWRDAVLKQVAEYTRTGTWPSLVRGRRVNPRGRRVGPSGPREFTAHQLRRGEYLIEHTPSGEQGFGRHLDDAAADLWVTMHSHDMTTLPRNEFVARARLIALGHTSNPKRRNPGLALNLWDPGNLQSALEAAARTAKASRRPVAVFKSGGKWKLSSIPRGPATSPAAAYYLVRPSGEVESYNNPESNPLPRSKPATVRMARVVRGTGATKAWLNFVAGDEVWESKPGDAMPLELARGLARAAGGRIEFAGTVAVTNPRGSVRERADQTFRMWHEFGPRGVKRMKGPDPVIPGTLVGLGELVKVVYRSPKYTGKQTLYEHTTKRPRPVLATDPDGRFLHIVGGKMRVTADGLVN